MVWNFTGKAAYKQSSVSSFSYFDALDCNLERPEISIRILRQSCTPFFFFSVNVFTYGPLPREHAV